MKTSKIIENGIEYEVFDFEVDDPLTQEVEQLRRKEHSIIRRHGHTYYFRYGEAHNDFGPAIIREFEDHYEEDYFQFGRRLKDGEQRSFLRTAWIDKMLKENNSLLLK